MAFVLTNIGTFLYFGLHIISVVPFAFFFLSCLSVSFSPFATILHGCVWGLCLLHYLNVLCPMWNTVFLGRMNICHSTHFHSSFFSCSVLAFFFSSRCCCCCFALSLFFVFNFSFIHNKHVFPGVHIQQIPFHRMEKGQKREGRKTEQKKSTPRSVQQKK